MGGGQRVRENGVREGVSVSLLEVYCMMTGGEEKGEK